MSDRLAALDAYQAEMVKAGPVEPRGDGVRPAAALLAALSADRPSDRPRVQHTPATSFRPGESLAVELRVGDGSVAGVRLRYRHANHAEEYGSAQMQGERGGYRAEIPGEYTDSPYPLLYLVELRDAAGRAWLQPVRQLGVAITPAVMEREKWYAFWDAPLLVPGLEEGRPPRNPGLPRRPDEIRRTRAAFNTAGCDVGTDGARLEVTFPGLSMG